MSDTLQQLLDMVLDEVGDDDVVISNGGASGSDDEGWFVMAHWHAHEGDGQYDLYVTSDTLRGALCAAIADPRFGQ